METIQLNNGLTIPVVGSGTNTFGKENREYMGTINGETTELKEAVANGYRLFDTAIAYRNEAVVAKGLKETGLGREAFFLTSKIPGEEAYYKDAAAVKEGVESSLAALDTDYIDLYLIHHPWDNLEQILAIWRVLEAFVDKGVLKAIGVSNFNQEQLGYLLEHSRIKPAVNQIESHPGNWNDAIIDFCLENHVVPEAWGPLTKVSDEAKETLSKIGAAYNKNWAQVALRYQVQRGVIVIPKSHNNERQQENLALFDFELSSEDMQKIATL